MRCNICSIFDATENDICKLCKTVQRVQYTKNDEWIFYYPPNGLKKINTFDDGNQKYENEPNQWLKIGHWRDHPEKVVLVNNITNKHISSISVWKVSDVITYEPSQ